MKYFLFNYNDVIKYIIYILIDHSFSYKSTKSIKFIQIIHLKRSFIILVINVIELDDNRIRSRGTLSADNYPWNLVRVIRKLSD